MTSAAPSTTRKYLLPVALGLLLPVAMTSCQGCKKDEPPPPLPSSTAPVVTSAPVLELAVEDAAVEADADAAKPKVGTGKPGGLARCCQALKQNAENAPMPTKAYLQNLAASCFAMSKQGATSFPAGAGVSGACK
jgi:hypothetical protein